MNFAAIHAEIALLVLACVVALVDLWKPGRDRIVTYTLTQLSLLVVALIQLWYFEQGMTRYAMERMVVADPMGHLLGVFATVAMMVTLVYARPYAASREMLKGELFTLSMFSLAASSSCSRQQIPVATSSSTDVASLYALVALRRDNAQATDAAMKDSC